MSRSVSFNKLTAQNFLSIGETPVVLDMSQKGMTRITGINMDNPERTNAIGKSTIMDAFSVVLFGEPIRDGIKKKEGLVNNRNKKNCRLALEFTITMENGDVKDYVVERGISPSFLNVTENGVEKTLDSIRNTEAYIREILVGDHSVFSNCIMLSVNASEPFMKKEAKDRREFIEGIFGLGVFRALAKKVLEDLKKQKEKVDIVASSLTTLNTTLKFSEKQLEDVTLSNEKVLLQKKISEDKWDIEIEAAKQANYKIQDSRQAIKDTYAKMVSDINDFNASLDAKKDLIISNYGSKIAALDDENEQKAAQKLAKRALLEEEIAVVEGVYTQETESFKASFANRAEKYAVIEKKQTERHDFHVRIEQQRGDIRSISRDLEAKNVRLSKYDVPSGTCPTCKQPLNAHSAEEIAAEKAQLEEDIGSTRSELKNKEAVLESSFAQYSQRVDKIDALKQEADSMVVEDGKMNAANAVLNAKRKELMALDTLFKPVDTSAMQKACLIEVSALKVKDTSGILSEEKAKLASLVEQDINGWKLNKSEALKAFVVKDITALEAIICNQKQEISSKMDELAKEKFLFDVLNVAKFIVSDEGAKAFFLRRTLDNLNDRIRGFMQRMGTKIVCKMDEALDETIIDENGNISSYGNLSGAERKTVDLACMFAFYGIKSDYGQVVYDALFFDEIFDTSFDPKGVELVMTLIKEETEMGNLKCFVITHNPILTPHFDREIIIKKENGFTELA